MMTKLRSGQGKRDDADAVADNDAADQSNTYMSPEKATQKRCFTNDLSTELRGQ